MAAMMRYVVVILLLAATPALAQTTPLTADQWKAAATYFRAQLQQSRGQVDDLSAQQAIDQQQIDSLKNQLTAAQKTNARNKP